MAAPNAMLGPLEPEPSALHAGFKDVSDEQLMEAAEEWLEKTLRLPLPAGAPLPELLANGWLLGKVAEVCGLQRRGKEAHLGVGDVPVGPRPQAAFVSDVCAYMQLLKDLECTPFFTADDVAQLRNTPLVCASLRDLDAALRRELGARGAAASPGPPAPWFARGGRTPSMRRTSSLRIASQFEGRAGEAAAPEAGAGTPAGKRCPAGPQQGKAALHLGPLEEQQAGGAGAWTIPAASPAPTLFYSPLPSTPAEAGGADKGSPAGSLGSLSTRSPDSIAGPERSPSPRKAPFMTPRTRQARALDNPAFSPGAATAAAAAAGPGPVLDCTPLALRLSPGGVSSKGSSPDGQLHTAGPETTLQACVPAPASPVASPAVAGAGLGGRSVASHPLGQSASLRESAAGASSRPSNARRGGLLHALGTGLALGLVLSRGAAALALLMASGDRRPGKKARQSVRVAMQQKPAEQSGPVVEAGQAGAAAAEAPPLELVQGLWGRELPGRWEGSARCASPVRGKAVSPVVQAGPALGRPAGASRALVQGLWGRELEGREWC